MNSLHKLYRKEIRDLTREQKKDSKQTERDLKAIDRAFAKLQKERTRIAAGISKRGAARLHRISILEGRLHS